MRDYNSSLYDSNKKVVPLLILPCLMGIKIGEGCKRESKGNMESNLCAVTCNKNCRVLGYEKMVTIYVNRYMHVANNYSATKNVWIFGETEQGERLKLGMK